MGSVMMKNAEEVTTSDMLVERDGGCLDVKSVDVADGWVTIKVSSIMMDNIKPLTVRVGRKVRVFNS